MKKLLLTTILIIMLSGCNNSKEETNEYIGYITFYDSDKIEIDDFEFINKDNKDRIKELNLSEKDMPNGYYIYNNSVETLKFDVSKKATYIFYDLGNLYVTENQDKKYITNNEKDFKDFLYYGSSTPRKTPFWIKIRNNKVICIEEEFIN